MATEIIEKEQYSEYDAKLNYSLDKIFLKCGDKLYKLEDVYIREAGKTARKVKSYKDYLSHLDNISVSPLNDVKPSKTALTKGYEIPSVRTEVDSADGLTKYYKTMADTGFKFGADKFALVHLDNSKNPTFVNLSDVYYFTGIRKTPVKFMPDILSNELFYKDQAITKIYTNNSFSFEGMKFKIEEEGVEKEIEATEETINLEKGEKIIYNLVYENGAPKLKVDGTFEYTKTIEPIKQTFVTQEYVKQTQQKENSAETKEVGMVDIKQYKVSENGDFVLVTLEDGTKPTMVKISDLKQEDGSNLKTSDTDPDKIDIKKHVGQSLKLTIAGKEVLTKPLTLSQVTIQYNSEKFYQETKSTTDIYTEQSKLKLKTGEYVCETEVAKQIYYKTLDSSTTNFDIYVAIVTNSSGSEMQIVVDKAYLERAMKGKSSTFSLDGYTFDVNKILKANRVANFSECDVVQTTSGVDANGKANKIESCKMYATKKERNADKETLDAKFVEDYKAGNYKLQTVYVNDKLVELDENGKRYVYSDSNLRVDHIQNNSDYKAMDVKPFYYESKDGELGKITGGPRYDVGKGISNSFKTWGKAAGYGLALSLSPAGILAALVAPPVFAVAAATAIVTPLAIPIVQGVKGLVKNTVNKNKWANPEKFNEKAWQKEMVQELTKLQEETKTSSKLSETHFIAECHEIDRLLVALQQAHIQEGFELVDGKAEITKNNAYAVCRFMEETKLENAILKDEISSAKLRKLKNTVKKLTAKTNLTEEEKYELEKAKRLLDKEEICSKYFSLKNKKKLSAAEQAELAIIESEYNDLKAEFKTKMTNYKSEPFVTDPNEKSKELTKNAQVVKGLLYLKHFAKDDMEITLEDGNIIKIADVKESLSEVDYDFEKNAFVVNRVKFSYDELKSKNASIDDMIDLSNINDVTAKLLLIKKLIESKTINDIITQKPDETEITETKEKDNNLVNEEANLISQIEQLNLELDELFKSTNEVLDAIEPKDYEIINAFKNKVENLRINCETALNYDEFAVSLDDLRDIISNLTNIKNDANLLKENSQKVSDYVKNIEAKAKLIDEAKTNIENKLNDKVTIAILSDLENQEMNNRLKSIIDKFEDNKKLAKDTTEFAILEQANTEIENIYKDINILSQDLNNIFVENNKKLILDSMEKIIQDTEAEIEKLENAELITMFPEYCKTLKKAKAQVVNAKSEIQKPETEIEAARLFKRKAAIIAQIVEVGVHAAFIGRHVKNVNASIETQQAANISIGKIENCVKVDLTMDVLELSQKLSEARSIYERELVPFLTLKKKETNQTTTTSGVKKMTSKSVISENALVAQLEDANSATYEHVLKLLQKGKHKLTEEEAVNAIMDFTYKVNAAHNQKVSASSSFETGSVEKYILVNGLKAMKTLITLDY